MGAVYRARDTKLGRDVAISADTRISERTEARAGSERNGRQGGPMVTRTATCADNR